MTTFFRSAIAMLGASAAVLACSGSTTTTSNGASSSGGGSSTPVATADCKSRCTNKGTSCGVTPDQSSPGCSNLCDGSVTDAQLTCLEGKACSELTSAPSLSAVCPPSTSGGSSGTSGGSGSSGTKQLGDACTCAGVSANAQGFCSGTDQECASSLSCVYEQGSSGKGTCDGARCCSDTAACTKDPSLLQACSAGTCKSTGIGFYCQK